MNIGVDFHGVIANTGAAKQRFAYEMFGVDVSPDCASKEGMVGRGILTLIQYDDLVQEIYATDRALTISPVPESVETLIDLSPGNKIQIVTASDPAEMTYIQRWLAQYNLGELAIATVGQGGSKNIDKFDVFVDDTQAHLRKLRGYVRRLLLFNQPYNLSWPLDADIARIDSLRALTNLT